MSVEIPVKTDPSMAGLPGPLKNARHLVSAALLMLMAVAACGAFVGISARDALSPSAIASYGGRAYTANALKSDHLWPLHFDADSSDSPNASSARILENGAELGPPHTIHARIAEAGDGAYSHWGDTVYFSASDNSDPRSNGKSYIFASTARLPMAMFGRIAALSVALLLLLWGKSLVRWGKSRLQVRQSAQKARAALLRISGSLGFLIVAVLCTAYLATIAQGAIYWLLLTAIAVAAIFALRWAAVLGSCCFGRSREWKGAATLALFVVSIGVCCAGMEVGLYLLKGGKVMAGPLVVRTGQAEITLPAELVARMEERRQFVTMPEEFKRTPVTVPGTHDAFRWQGELHMHDENHFRRKDGPFPPKDPRVFRVMVVGDSFTYGDGIDAEWTYTAQLQRLFGKHYNIEFINLGADGLQSEDIARQIERMAPVLQPDLIVYGVCLNDFLPSGVDQYSNGFGVPLPEWFKSMSLSRTRLAGLLEHGYTTLLLMLGIRADFYDDILANFQGYQERFGKDIEHMNAFALAKGLPPITGIVLDQFAIYGARGYHLAKTAEKLMLKAGFDVIPTEEYYKKYDGHHFMVSHWEGHPNEQADAIFATMIADRLIGRFDLSKYLKSAQPDTSAPHAAAPGG